MFSDLGSFTNSLKTAFAVCLLILPSDLSLKTPGINTDALAPNFSLTPTPINFEVELETVIKLAETFEVLFLTSPSAVKCSGALTTA
ncbi:hypothetical protein D3C86_2025010 [compost metagenome]